ncbi:MAG: DUF1559 domain-containing protein [Planctomycetes bacterium]|nr:DUF1559 domain-containing protein [Planctomycetota bacterium]
MVRHGLRRAFSVVELIVVLAVLGMLASLALVGLQHARAAAMRTRCSANLQQMGTAVHQFASNRRTLPGDDGSFLLQLLPFSESAAMSRDPHVRDREELLRRTHIPLFTCPADAAPYIFEGSSNGYAGVNYVGNSGTWFIKTGFDGVFRYRAYGPPVSLADIRDGASNTGLICEALRGDLSFDRLRSNLQTNHQFQYPSELDDFASHCKSVPPSDAIHGWLGDPGSKGTPWTITNVCITLYNHVLTPNLPSCFNGGDVVSGAATVSSFHPRGVNLLYVDGHVAFVTDRIESSIWRSIGTVSDTRR